MASPFNVLWDAATATVLASAATQAPSVVV